jgi:hypothetical protein
MVARASRCFSRRSVNNWRAIMPTGIANLVLSVPLEKNVLLIFNQKGLDFLMGAGEEVVSAQTLK